MASPLELYIQTITEALARIRALLFVSLGLCAIVLSNAYLETFSFDDALVRHSYVFKQVLDKKKSEADVKLSMTQDYDEQTQLHSQLSELRARMDRVDNSLKDYKLRSVSIPLTGVNVPANDLNVVCGIFLLCLSLWIVFSVNQLRSAVRDEAHRAGLAEYRSALRHSVVLMVSNEQTVLRLLALLLITAPAIAMTIATLTDLISIRNYDLRQQLSPFLTLLIVRLVFLTAMTAGLWVSSVVCIRAWKELGDVVRGR